MRLVYTRVFVLCCIATATATATWEKYALQFKVGWECRRWWEEEAEDGMNVATM